MDTNESGRVKGTEQLANEQPANHDNAHQADPSVTEKHNGLYEEVERLRLEVEHLRDTQQALQRTPHTNDLNVDDEVHDDER